MASRGLVLIAVGLLCGCSRGAQDIPTRRNQDSNPQDQRERDVATVRSQLRALAARSPSNPDAYEAGWQDLIVYSHRLEPLDVGDSGGLRLRDSVRVALRAYYSPRIRQALGQLPELARFVTLFEDANGEMKGVHFRGIPLTPAMDSAASRLQSLSYTVDSWGDSAETAYWRRLGSATTDYLRHKELTGNVTRAWVRYAENSSATAALRRMEEENAEGARALQRRLQGMTPETRRKWESAQWDSAKKSLCELWNPKPPQCQ